MLMQLQVDYQTTRKNQRVYTQELGSTVNQPGATNNTRYGIGKTLTMNRDEVEEDLSEDEGTEAFSTEDTEAFEDKGI